MRRGSWTFWGGMITWVLAMAAAVVAGSTNVPPNVILIGWDGAQRAHVHECVQRGELPTLQGLQRVGALVDIDVVSGATDTKAGWTQILTGYDPEITGVFSNGRYRDIPEGYSVFERLKKAFGTNFVCVAVIGKRSHCGEIEPPFKKPLPTNAVSEHSGARRRRRAIAAGTNTPARTHRIATQGATTEVRQPGAGRGLRGRVVEEGGVRYLVFDGSPYYTMHKACDVWEYGLIEDERVGQRTLELLEYFKDRPFFFFVHFASVDHQGHRYGENSREYNDALISNDRWTGRILDKLRELGLAERTYVYVTADHGFDEGARSHHYAPYIFLATNDREVKRNGMRQDIAPTLLDRFGLDLGSFQPPLSGESLRKPANRPVRTAPEQRSEARPRRAG